VFNKCSSLILGRYAAVDVVIFVCFIEKEELAVFVRLDIGLIVNSMFLFEVRSSKDRSLRLNFILCRLSSFQT